jgi:hypothetical protein
MRISTISQYHSTASWKCIGSNGREVLWDKNAINAGSSKGFSLDVGQI